MSDTEALRLCPECQAATSPRAERCWLCRAALPAFERRLPLSALVPEPPPAGMGRDATEAGARRVERDLGPWAAASVASIAVVVVGLGELASDDPLRAALLAALCAPAVVALGWMLWLRRPRPDARPQAVGTMTLPRAAARGALAATALALALLAASVLVHTYVALLVP